MIVSLIVAMAQGGIIGRKGELPWDLPEDRAYFRRTTMGHPVIMGRRTHESIGALLSGRQNIVLTRNPSYRVAGGVVVASVPAALEAAGDATEVFAIGGEDVYREFLPVAQRLYITHLETMVAGDRRFPSVDWEEWRLVSETSGTAAAAPAAAPIRFGVYHRIEEREGGGG